MDCPIQSARIDRRGWGVELKMGSLLYFASAVALICSPATAQKAGADGAGPDAATIAGDTKLPEAEVGAQPEYVPMSFSERARKYIIASFGVGAVLRAAALGGITQWTDTPGEWRQGSEAYGERLGSSFAENVIRQALEFGSSTALRQDNRYFRSTETGFVKRSKHAVASVFVARTEGGGEQVAYSRLGAVLGSAFLSRLWQPRSEDGAGDAAACFGLNMAADIGWNFLHEFCPRSVARRLHLH